VLIGDATENLLMNYNPVPLMTCAVGLARNSFKRTTELFPLWIQFPGPCPLLRAFDSSRRTSIDNQWNAQPARRGELMFAQRIKEAY